MRGGARAGPACLPPRDGPGDEPGALAIGGEAVFPVPPLPVPDPAAQSAAHVAAADAVRLFELRARQVRPAFRLDDGNAAAVAEICRRLDGLPLGIELAAARVRVLTPAQIAAGLSDRFRLLAGLPGRVHVRR